MALTLDHTSVIAVIVTVVGQSTGSSACSNCPTIILHSQMSGTRQEGSRYHFKVFGMTQPGFEPRSPDCEADALTTQLTRLVKPYTNMSKIITPYISYLIYLPFAKRLFTTNIAYVLIQLYTCTCMYCISMSVGMERLSVYCVRFQQRVCDLAQSINKLKEYYEIVGESRPLSAFFPTHADLFTEMHFYS